ncbi:4-phosphopantetheinyl transferase [Streptomyces tateyamensis]|uniref:4-phosphopantetheinyl transferase n=1 Tax=Streptomyces tateyamensis TaxID=565073 RepID=A0A2V4P0B8_9ACTN|nr:4'-phosphopantetheinyl transferase superfamily protein [Streptomyces tateyamensis]PYC73560.1 4-phosphopantetheinyl transferase [Streptomyces tateyamensis]
MAVQPIPGVLVWRVPVTEAGAAFAAGAAPALLDRTELARAAAFRRPQDRTLYEIAHVALRTVLGEQLDRKPAELVFHQAPCPGCGQPHGRPEVPGPVQFSLSHAPGLALIALANAPVGVDVEGREVFAGQAGHEVAGMLHPAERAELDRVGVQEPARWSAAALRCWVRKEAYLKGTGIGLGRGAGAEYVGVGPGFGVGSSAGGPDAPMGWQLQAVAVPEQYDAAVAVLSDDQLPLEVRELTLT